MIENCIETLPDNDFGRPARKPSVLSALHGSSAEYHWKRTEKWAGLISYKLIPQHDDPIRQTVH